MVLRTQTPVNDATLLAFFDIVPPGEVILTRVRSLCVFVCVVRACVRACVRHVCVHVCLCLCACVRPWLVFLQYNNRGEDACGPRRARAEQPCSLGA